MSKSDKHIDISWLLHQYGEKYLEYSDMGRKRDTKGMFKDAVELNEIATQIADFYRNKIPEKKPYFPKDLDFKKGWSQGYNQAIQDVITTQFYSKAGNNE